MTKTDKNANKRSLPPSPTSSSTLQKSPALKKPAMTGAGNDQSIGKTGSNGVPKDSTPTSESSVESFVSKMDVNENPIVFPEFYTSKLEVVTESSDKNIGNLHPFSLSKMLSKVTNSVHQIDSLGRNKIKITFNSVSGANSFLLNTEFHSTNKIHSFIPQSLLFKLGIVKNVPTEITVEELQQVVSCHSKVHSIRRLQKKVDGKLVPLPVIEVKFFGTSLPDYVYFYNLRCRVEPSVRNPLQCFKCLRYNHTAIQCRSQARCPKCGNDHKQEDCVSSVEAAKCIHCGGKHLATDRSCPAYQKQKQIKKIMAFENLSYREAARFHQNRFASKAFSFAEVAAENSTVLQTNPPTVNGSSNSGLNPHKGTKFVERHWNKDPKNHFPVVKPYQMTTEYGNVLRAAENLRNSNGSGGGSGFPSELKEARAIAAIRDLLPGSIVNKERDVVIKSLIVELIRDIVSELSHDNPSDLINNSNPSVSNLAKLN